MLSRRKIWKTSSLHAPYTLGYTRATMNITNMLQFCKKKLIYKNILSSDYRLQLAYMKVESLVIAGQHTAVNLFSGLVHTARHTLEAD